MSFNSYLMPYIKIFLKIERFKSKTIKCTAENTGQKICYLELK